MIELSIKMTPRLSVLMAGIRGDLPGGIRAGMLNVVETIEAHGVKEAPVETSDLVNSITSYLAGTTGVVKATAGHASYVHEGTRPHVILPRDKKALYWPGAGHPVKKVHHPGTKANPFFERAIRKANPQRAFEEGLSNYLRGRRH